MVHNLLYYCVDHLKNNKKVYLCSLKFEQNCKLEHFDFIETNFS